MEIDSPPLNMTEEDRSSTWCEGPVALGHQMLLTTPESLHEKLPIDDEQSGLVITADARIDNRKELSKLLELENIENIPDSLFILKAYEKWGEKCPEKLLGDFTFAIWDKNNEKLFCARDHMGVKPFYYYLSGDAFFFATEMKALFTIPEVPCKVDEMKMASFVLINTQDKLLTFYEDVFCLVPAHSLGLNSSESQIRQYWKLDPKLEILMDSDEDYINAFREVFAEAVKCRLRSAFPVGFELSGGLDSSSVVCTAKKIYRKKSPSNNINTFSYVFDDFPEVDERYYIEKVINAGGIEPNFVFADKISPLEQIKTILWHQEQPFYTPNMAIMWNSYKKMEEKGIRILLGGNGGDEIISHGESYLKELAITFKWKKLMNELKAMPKHSNTSYYQLMVTYFIFPIIPEIFKNLTSRVKKGDMFKKNGTLILNKDFVKKLGGEKYLKNLKWNSVKEVNTAKKNHYLSITSNQYVLEMLDRGTAAFSIEPRYPYYDKRLIEFCYAIPDEMKFKFGWDR
ncbi:MAG: lasso peptide isopeptide bond-forming cyclase, partial [Methanobacterium paludis]|nr:lasso peptide isopeptide bond-forming cyclase [Methanobacterium paludis]